MLELQTFGTVGLRSRDIGASVANIVQPKRLALLTYLSLAPRRRCRRRDQIVGLFWPELDQEHARGALNQAVRYLRRALGSEVLVSQGEEEIRTDENALWCDARAFASAIEAGEHEAALAVYKGQFLEGLFVEGASPAYNEWVDNERNGFRRTAGHAASELSIQAERRGDFTDAVRWARRSQAVSPDDEPVTARLISLLDRSGDRVGALRAYDALRQQLREEYHASPSRETEALVAAIRAG
jgi:DNA-binding SARP family transcriptional activator